MTALLTGFLMSGCGKDNDSASALDSAQSKLEQMSEADSGTEETATETEDEDITSKLESSGPGFKTPSDDEAEDTESDASLIEGNGGYFVKLEDGGIYFHKYDAEAFEETAFDADFLSYTYNDCDATVLCRYDETTDKVTEIVKDGYTGKLYWLGDRFYCDHNLDGGTTVGWIKPDGQTDIFLHAMIAGESSSNKYLAMWDYTKKKRSLLIINETGEEEYNIEIPDGYNYDFCGLADDTSIIFTVDQDDFSVTMHSLNASESVRLGDLSMTGGYGSPVCDEFFFDGEYVYCMLGWYGGPVNSLEDYMFIRCIPGKEDSVEELYHGYDPAVMPEKAQWSYEPAFEVTDGKVTFDNYHKDDVFLTNYNRTGTLALYEGNDEYLPIRNNLIQYDTRENLRLQTAVKLGDYVYAMIASCHRDTDNDYSVYRAYAFNDMYYLQIPADGSDVTKSLFSSDWDKYDTFRYEDYEPFCGTWQMIAESPEGSSERTMSDFGYKIIFKEDLTADFTGADNLGHGYKISVYKDGQTAYAGGSGPEGNENQQFSSHIDENGELILTINQIMWHDDGTFDALTWTGYFMKLN